MKRISLIALALLALVCVNSLASGISVDAGLTPGEGRWIFRTQYRHIEWDDDPTMMEREMTMQMVPVVLAYGLDSKLTLMAMQPLMRRRMTMMGKTMTDEGFGDFFFMAKYKLYRKNTRHNIFGMAATLGLEAPTGSDEFTSDTWDLKPGMFASLRHGRWASDFSVAHKWNGFSDDAPGGFNPGDEFEADWAIAYQFPMNEKSTISLTPVLELNYRITSADTIKGKKLPHTGGSYLFVSPGLKFTRSSLILEMLVPVVVHEAPRGKQLKYKFGALLGVRYMF